MGLTKEKLYSHYLPMVGGASAVLFSANVMHPAGFKKIFSPFELAFANSLWFNAHIGIGMYLYTRRHMTPDAEWKKIGFSVFGSVLFNFGSVLLMATLKKLLPEDETVRTVTGVVVSAGLVCAGKQYLKLIDSKVLG